MGKKVFRNFEEFVSLTRPLNLDQRRKLVESLPQIERKSLIASWQSDGWEDLFIRNEIDEILDGLRERFGEDLIFMRIQILNGAIRKIRKSFWMAVCEALEPYADKHKAYVLEGIQSEELGDDWILLVPYKRRGK